MASFHTPAAAAAAAGLVAPLHLPPFPTSLSRQLTYSPRNRARPSRSAGSIQDQMMDSAEHKVRAPSRHDQFYLLLILLEKEPSFAVLLVDLSFVGWLLAWLRSLQVIGIAAAAAAEPGRPCCVECRTTATPMWRGGPTGPRVSSFLSPYRVICPHRPLAVLACAVWPSGDDRTSRSWHSAVRAHDRRWDDRLITSCQPLLDLGTQ